MRQPGVRQRLRSTFVATFGRKIRCEACGEVVVKAVPIIWNGEVYLIGAEHGLLAVDFTSMTRLAFRHVEVRDCAGERS